MRFTHLTSKDYVVSNWSGGKTIQIAIAPEGAVYADRDFLWRVSSATADLDESDYTPLPDYERWLSVFDRPYAKYRRRSTLQAHPCAAP